MKSIATNTLAYIGKVTLSQYVGSKKVEVCQLHNEGGQPLFDFLANCFLGDFAAAKLNLPRKIGLFIENGQGYGFHTLTSRPKRVDGIATGSAVCFSFSIPFEVISPITTFEHAFIGLYTEQASIDGDFANYLARFSLKGLSRSLFLDAALVVDWELQVINGGTEYGSSAPND